MSKTTQKQNYTPAIVVMFALFFMIAFVTNFAGSMGVIVKSQFLGEGAGAKALAQLGTLANFIAYLCFGIPCGVLLKRKGYKLTALTAVTVGFVGVGIQWLAGPAESFLVYVIGAFVAGISMCLLNVVVNPLLNVLGGGGNKGNQLIQFGGSCNSIGGTIAPILLGYLIGGSVEGASVKDAAPAMLIAMGIFAIAFGIIAMTNIPEPHMETPKEKAARKSGVLQKDAHSPLSFRHFVLGALAIFFYVGTEVGIPNTANVYFSEKVGADITGLMIGAYWFSMMIGRLVGGAAGAKISSKSMLTFTASVAIILLLAFIFTPFGVNLTLGQKIIPLQLLFITLCGLCTSVMWGAIFNLAVEGLGKYTAAASGIFMTMVCGGGIIPFLQGLLAGAPGIGTVHSYWLLIACLGYLIFYALVGSKNVNKDINVE